MTAPARSAEGEFWQSLVSYLSDGEVDLFEPAAPPPRRVSPKTPEYVADINRLAGRVAQRRAA